MWKKLKHYFRFPKEKPDYHIEGSVYGGLRMDIDKFYSLNENKKELQEINESFGKMFGREREDKKDAKIQESTEKY
jgi:hypothetical protein